MKFRFNHALVLFALCVPHEALAAPTTVSVTTPTIIVDEKLQATLWVQKNSKKCEIHSPTSGSSSQLELSSGGTTPSSETNLRAILMGGSQASTDVRKTRQILTDLAEKRLQVKCDDKKPVFVTVAKAQNMPESIFSGDAVAVDSYTWSALSADYAPIIKAALGAVSECRYADTANDTNLKKNCKVQGGNSPTFVIDSQPQQGYVEIEFSTGAKVRAPIKSCQFVPVGALSSLVIGANFQRISLIPREEQCAAFMSDGPLTLKSDKDTIDGKLVSARQDDATRLASPSAEDKPAPARSRASAMEIAVPSTIQVGVTDWTLYRNGNPYGTIRLKALPAPTVAPVLAVNYRHPVLARAQSGKSEQSTAVVNPVYHDKKWRDEQGKPTDSHQEVVNVASIQLDSALEGLRHSEEEKKDGGSYRVWVVQEHGSTWSHDQFAFFGCRNQIASETEKECILPSAGQIQFAVGAPGEVPLETTLRLEERKQGTKERVMLLSVRVQLVKRAQLESIPLAIAQAIRIECVGTNRDNPQRADEDYDIASNGSRKAIAYEAMPKGDCKAVFDPSTFAQDMRPILPLFGPQVLKIDVKHAKGEESVKRWIVQPRNAPRIDSEFSIAEQRRRGDVDMTNPLDTTITMTDDNDFDYDVHIALDPQPNQTVVYRPPMPQSNGSTAERAEFNFAARLHSRGRFGWRVLPIRTFITAPIAVGGFRFPAISRELKSSSDPTAVQFVAPRTGVLFAVEPWNYDRSNNPIPFRPRLVTGIHALSVSSVVFRPSWVTGIGFTLPILDAKTKAVNVDASAAFLYEVDLQERFPFRDGSRFLMTVGVDVGALLGAN